MSKGFICAIVGIVLSALSWFIPWLWPVALPAFALLSLATHLQVDEQRYRAVIFVSVFVVNIALWALVTYGAWRVAAKFRHAK